MLPKPPARIEDMQVLYYADVRQQRNWLKKYMTRVPDCLVLVYWPQDKSYCIVGTDAAFAHWEAYPNYAFKELRPALEFPDTILRLPEWEWVKV